MVLIVMMVCLRRRIGQRRGVTRASPGIHELMGLPRLAGWAFFQLCLLAAFLPINLWLNCGKPDAVRQHFEVCEKPNIPTCWGGRLKPALSGSGVTANHPAQNGYAASDGPITNGSGRRLPGGGP